MVKLREGNGAGRVWRMGFSLPSHMVLSYLIPAWDMGNIFLPYPCPLGPRKAPLHPVKLYFLLICLQLFQLFLINLSHQIKLIFRKKLNNIIKWFNKTISQQK